MFCQFLKIFRLKKQGRVFALCVLILFLAVRAVFALDLRKPFTHYADQEELTSVLTDLARQCGKNATFTPAVKGVVSGRFDEVRSGKFLNGMKAAFGACWYEQGNTLNFYHESETGRAFLSSHVLPLDSLYRMLHSSSVVSPQLPLEKMPAGDMLLVTGPPIYIEQIRNVIAALEEAQIGNTVMRVFPLKYAWAEDITVNSSMDTRMTIPGVASILRAMVTGQPLSGASATLIPSAMPHLGGQGLAAQGKAEEPAQSGQATQAPQNEKTAQAPAVNIIADPRVNAVMVMDAEYRMSYYAKVIEDLDKPVELVEIHAAIVDIDSNFQRDLGIDFQGRRFNNNGWSVGGTVSGGNSAFATMPTPGTAADSGLTLSTLYTHGSDFFLARVQALEEKGDARMLGRPSVLTMDNIQATLENTTTYYVPVSGTNGATAVPDLFKVEAGTVLKVTPHVIHATSPNEGNSIKLVVNVQDDQDNDTSTNSADVGALPPIKQTKINTQAVVNEGQSLLIGGYYYERQSDSESGVPGLMNIPVLGHLFKTKEKVNKRMERLILITPRLVGLNEVPSRVDDPRFHQNAVQADYEERTPVVNTGSGCVRRAKPIDPQEPSPVVPTGASR